MNFDIVFRIYNSNICGRKLQWKPRYNCTYIFKLKNEIFSNGNLKLSLMIENLI